MYYVSIAIDVWCKYVTYIKIMFGLFWQLTDIESSDKQINKDVKQCCIMFDRF